MIGKTDLNWMIKFFFGLFFSFTLPLGILIGLFTSQGDLLSEGFMFISIL